ncbi:MAG: hypothetical protein CR982_02490 [Candidatus Cloacimonadota bacterium]|nr:MAG: hypothetical protein CR982_02490 [Candidatus Cloacimonadota bacterium]PIE78529.1 MAG: hypothetical protein CSA15_07490 [Candidatus Delongbacteria bacterium]
MKFIILIIITTIILSCSKEDERNYTVKEIGGITTFKNSNKPSKELILKPKKIFTIDGNSGDSSQVLKRPVGVSVDSNKDIYILDIIESNIKKYDSNGNFIKAISKKGMGPGELSFPNSMAILEDTIYVANSGQKKIVKLDKDGNYIGDIFLSNELIELFQPVGKDRFLGYVGGVNQEKNEIGLNLSILNKRFEVIKELVPNRINLSDPNNNILNIISPYAVSEKGIFISSNSKNRYSINVYNFNGEPTYNIEKWYKKIKLTDDESEQFNKAMKKIGSRSGVPEVKYKKAINNLFVDNQGRLWVKVSLQRSKDSENNFVIDIFKDGVFLNRVEFDELTTEDFFNPETRLFVYDNRIFIFDRDSNSLSVYQY